MNLFKYLPQMVIKSLKAQNSGFSVPEYQDTSYNLTAQLYPIIPLLLLLLLFATFSVVAFMLHKQKQSKTM
ncbi:hypothetical protein MD537_01645 [Flavihumibacter sediminis]|nr:hypothetical protein [Flavihumibacter sediminis]